MDKQPLNTGEQKDMTEFFTDLITKIEEMSQELVHTNTNMHTHYMDDTGLLYEIQVQISRQHTQGGMVKGGINNNMPE